jgi:hypothetical protein
MENLEGDVCADRPAGGAEVRFCTVRDECSLKFISLVLRWRIWRVTYALIGLQGARRSASAQCVMGVIQDVLAWPCDGGFGGGSMHR